MVRNLFFALLGLFTFAAAFITAEALCFSRRYEDGIAVIAHAERSFILCHHEAEHHLQADQQRMEIPNDGRLVQQRDPVGGRNAAEGSNTLRHQLLFVSIECIAMFIEILAGYEGEGHIS